MVPLAITLRRHAHAHGVSGILVDAMAAFGIAAAVLKTLGIVRWLIAMPSLAGLYAGTADPMVRTAVEVNYVALNGYAGAVGELLGVQLFSGVWMVLLGLILGRTGLRLNGIASLMIGIGFALTALRTLVPDVAILNAILPPIALAWLVALAITLWRRG
jgi:hypothetical protein